MKAKNAHMMEQFDNLLAKIPNEYPDIWEKVESLFMQKPTVWPEWCFLPIFSWMNALGVDEKKYRNSQLMLKVEFTMAIGTWRYTKGVYRFSKEVFDSITRVKIEGKFPFKILFNLPEWCVYIETPGLVYKSREVVGIWFLNKFNFTENVSSILFNMGFVDNGGVEIMFHNLKHRNATLDEVLAKYVDREERDTIHKIMTLALYLCSEQPEIDNEREPTSRPHYPQITITKDGPRIFEAPKVRTWDVGKQTGEIIRRERENTLRSAKSPHIRRGHWHGYWTGSRKGERVFKYNWIPPIFVVGSKEDSLPTLRRANGQTESSGDRFNQAF